MKSFLLLQAVLLWAVVNAKLNAGFQTFLQDTDFPRNDIQHAKAPDGQYCQRLCSAHPSCTHFTFAKDRYDCYMKHVQAGFTLQSTKAVGAVSGYAIPASLMNNYKCYDRLFEDTDFPGCDVMFLLRNNKEECREACNKYEDCEFFTFNKLNKFCFLKSITKLPGPTKINIVRGLVSGFTLKDCHPHVACGKECSDLVLNNVDFPGYDFARVLTPDVDRCQLVCNALPRCKFFTFIRKTHPNVNLRFTCSLKSFDKDLPGKTSSGVQHYQSGFSLRSVRRHKSCSLEIYDDLDFPGDDQRQLKVKTYRACQQKCTADPLCQFWTYVKKDFPRAELRDTCYLKNVLALPTPPVIAHTTEGVSGFSQKKCILGDNSESDEIESEESQQVQE